MPTPPRLKPVHLAILATLAAGRQPKRGAAGLPWVIGHGYAARRNDGTLILTKAGTAEAEKHAYEAGSHE